MNTAKISNQAYLKALNRAMARYDRLIERCDDKLKIVHMEMGKLDLLEEQLNIIRIKQGGLK